MSSVVILYITGQKCVEEVELSYFINGRHYVKKYELDDFYKLKNY